MHEYQSRYERAHSGRVYIRWLIIIGVILCICMFGLLWVTDYIENQHLTVTQRDFTDLELEFFEYDNGIKLADELSPVYAFTQGMTDNGATYEGFVFDINHEVKDMLQHCFGMSYDGEANQQIANTCDDFFEQGKKYKGATVRIQTEDGGTKAILFTAQDVHYQLFVFHNDAGDLQLMARKEC